MSGTGPARAAVRGWLGFTAGATALILTLVVFRAGPVAPQPAAGVTLGECAADIARSAARSVAGQARPQPEARPRTLDDRPDPGVGVLAGLAVVPGGAALVREERRQAAPSGIVPGGRAPGVQLFTFRIATIAAAMVIAAPIHALRDGFGGLFGG